MHTMVVQIVYIKLTIYTTLIIAVAGLLLLYSCCIYRQ